MSTFGSQRVSVIVPVHNRERDLRRALESVRCQHHSDLECLVVDDASSVDIAAIVTELGDPRFRCIRRAVNGGPSAARRSAYAEMSGMFALALDSDWELYPWALAQGVHYLLNCPGADIACALHVRHEDSRLFVRARERLIDPHEFRTMEPVPDRVAMVRRPVVDRWLSIPGDYFALEAGLWITAALHHASLALDEPWVRYHTQAQESVTVSMAGDGIRHRLRDYVTFLDERQDLIGCGPCISVDRILEDIYFDLLCARHPYRTVACEALRSRGIHPREAIGRQSSARLRRKLSGQPKVRLV